MNSITAVLAWDYLRRNYMLLLICFVIAIFSIVPDSSFVAGSYYDKSPELRAFTYNDVMFKPILIILLGLTFTQSQIARLYLKPISNFAIVAQCYLPGALLFAIQIAIIVGLWKWYYNLVDWPIVQPVLYAMLYWGTFCPLSCYLFNSSRGSVVALLAWIVNVFTCLLIIMGFNFEKLVAPDQETRASFLTLGLTPTVANVSFTAAVLAVGLFAMLQIVIRGRKDCCFRATAGAPDGAGWFKIAETTSLRSFANSREACQDFDCRYRTVPACLFLFSFFFVGLIIYLSCLKWRSLELIGDMPSMLDDVLVLCFPMLTALFFVFVIILRIPIPISLTSIIWTPELNNALLQYRQYSFDGYFRSLPIADQDIVDGKLRSSFVPVAYAFPAIFLLPYLFSYLLMWGVGRGSQYGADFTPMPDRILTVSLARSLTLAFAWVGVAFVILNIQAVVTAFLITPYRWALPLIAFSVALYCDIPLAYSLGLALLLSLVVIAYNFMKLAGVDRECLSQAAKLIPGTCGLSLACLTVAGYAEAQSCHQVAIASLSLALALTLMAMTVLATELTVGHFRRS